MLCVYKRWESSGWKQCKASRCDRWLHQKAKVRRSQKWSKGWKRHHVSDVCCPRYLLWWWYHWRSHWFFDSWHSNDPIHHLDCALLSNDSARDPAKAPIRVRFSLRCHSWLRNKSKRIADLWDTQRHVILGMSVLGGSSFGQHCNCNFFHGSLERHEVRLAEYQGLRSLHHQYGRPPSKRQSVAKTLWVPARAFWFESPSFKSPFRREAQSLLVPPFQRWKAHLLR